MKKKIKIILAIGFVGLVLTIGLTIWAGITAFNFAASEANKLIESPVAREQITEVQQKAKEGLAGFQPLSCWVRAQSLLSVEPWLARPLVENFINLKTACLGGPTQICEEGSECPQIENTTTSEGETI